ncbi:ABC transporter substrate-binding protein [Flexivirga alba]|uniref:ABC transporter substrate-binding protein n=1 Tax=Flexivirga alba TaxID=702742 RepID=A0ABW2AKX6_9MICO
MQHLVGMHDASWQAMYDGILGEIFPSAIDIPHNVATNSFAPNVESVLALEPDLVIQWGDNGAAIIDPLENAGLKVAALKYGTQDDVARWIALFATALGRPDRARELNSPISAALKTLSAVGRSAPKPAPKILYFNRFEGGLKVAATGSYNDFYIKLVGGQNPASGPHGAPGTGMVGVDIEQVLSWDPDIILLGNFDAAMPDDVYQSAVWRDQTAVKTRRVYKVPLGGYRWDPPSHESPLMWRWLSMVAFPQQQPFDLGAEVRTSYKRFYNHAPTAAQLAQILWLKANGASSGYRQFHA